MKVKFLKQTKVVLSETSSDITICNEGDIIEMERKIVADGLIKDGFCVLYDEKQEQKVIKPEYEKKIVTPKTEKKGESK